MGPYEVRDLRGAGAWGEVYVARDVRLGRDVALKVLRPGNGPSARGPEALLSEARAASALSHPAIATIYEADETTVDGRPLAYIAMELVDGPTLGDHARAGAPLDELVGLVQQVADGLAAAHARGVVHRDVKPSNVLVAEGPRAKLVDFGLATRCDALDQDALETLAPGDGTGSPSTGEIAGTAAYMSPEQVRGEEADGRSDVFALGAVLYELLTGRRAFPGETVGAVLASVVGTDPPPASSVNPEVSGELSSVVARMLAKDRALRSPSMEEVAEELAAARHPRTGPAALPPRDPAGGACVAVTTFANVSGRPEDDWLETGLVESLTAELRAAAGASVVGTDRVHETVRRLREERRGRREGLAEEAGRRLGARWVASGAFQRVGERLRVTASLADAWSGEVLRAVKVDGTLDGIFALQDAVGRELAAALRSACGLAGEGARSPAGTSVVEAYEAHAKGLVELRAGSLASLERAEALFERAIALDPRWAAGHVSLGWALSDRAEYAGDPGPSERALAAFRRAIELEPASSEAFRGLAYANLFLRRDAEALAAARRSLELAPSDAAGHQAVARVLFIANGDFLGAAREYETALALNPQAGWVALQLAHCLALIGELPRAEAVARRAIELQTQALSGKKGLLIVGSHVRLAQVHALAGRWAEAVTELVEERRHLESVDHALRGRTTVEVEARLGSALGHLGREADARAALARSVAAFEERLAAGRDDPFTRYYVAVARTLLGETARALDALAEAARLRPSLTLRRALVEPDLAPLREEPRFRALLADAGLAAA